MAKVIAFYLYFFIQKNLYFFRKHIWKNIVYIVAFVLQFFRAACYWKCNIKTPTLMQICTGFVDAKLGSRILSNRLGMLTQILIVFDYYFLFLYFTFNLEKSQSVYLKYAYLKYVYITLKTLKRIRKTQFVSAANL